MGETLQAFCESLAGQITITVIILVILFLILRNNDDKDKKTDIRALAVSALMIALALVLGQIKIFEMPQGGSVTLLSNLPIVLVGYFYGTRRGVMAGVCVGLLELMFGPYVIHPLQLLLDYPIAFGAMGLSGLVRNKKGGLTLGYIIGILGRYVCAILSGVIFFAEYAPENFNAFTWSVWYNFTYLAVEGVITIILLNVPAVKKMLNNLKLQLNN